MRGPPCPSVKISFVDTETEQLINDVNAGVGRQQRKDVIVIGAVLLLAAVFLGLSKQRGGVIFSAFVGALIATPIAAMRILQRRRYPQHVAETLSDPRNIAQIVACPRKTAFVGIQRVDKGALRFEKMPLTTWSKLNDFAVRRGVTVDVVQRPAAVIAAIRAPKKPSSTS